MNSISMKKIFLKSFSILLILMIIFVGAFSSAPTMSFALDKDTSKTDKKNTDNNKNEKKGKSSSGKSDKKEESAGEDDEQALKLKSSSAVLYCENTGEVIYKKNANTRIEPGEATLMLSTHIALERMPQDKKVKVNDGDVGKGISSFGLVSGEEVAVEDLVKLAMLVSAGDATSTLLSTAITDGSNIVDIMNETAQKAGCSRTHFSSPFGVKDAENYSTAMDMVYLAKALMENGLLKTAGSTKSFKLSTTARKVEVAADSEEAKNKYVTWVKTSSVDGSPGVIFGYEENGLKLIVALYNSGTTANRLSDAKKLINYGKKIVKGVTVVRKGEYIEKVRLFGGAKTKVKTYAAYDGKAFLPKEATKNLITTKAEFKSDIKPPLKQGDEVGYLLIYVADEQTNKIPLVVKDAVGKGWIFSKIGLSNLTVIIIGLIILFILFCIYRIRRYNKRMARRRARLRKELIRQEAIRQLQEEESKRRRGWYF